MYYFFMGDDNFLSQYYFLQINCWWHCKWQWQYKCCYNVLRPKPWTTFSLFCRLPLAKYAHLWLIDIPVSCQFNGFEEKVHWANGKSRSTVRQPGYLKYGALRPLWDVSVHKVYTRVYSSSYWLLSWAFINLPLAGCSHIHMVHQDVTAM